MANRDSMSGGPSADGSAADGGRTVTLTAKELHEARWAMVEQAERDAKAVVRLLYEWGEQGVAEPHRDLPLRTAAGKARD